jgi:mono/diheme cytochrome c family protein
MKISMLLGLGALMSTGFCFFCAAQGTPGKMESASGYAELEKARAKYRAKANPLVKDKDAVPAGKVLFEEHCAECHGEDALGTKKAPGLRAQEVQSASPGAVFWILTNGVVRNGMPVWSKLPEPQRWQLVSYVQSLGPAEAPENKTPAKL